MDADKGEQQYDDGDGACSNAPRAPHDAYSVALPENCFTLSIALKQPLPVTQAELMLLYAILPELLREMEQDISDAIIVDKASQP